jgi:hypothetical protein
MPLKAADICFPPSQRKAKIKQVLGVLSVSAVKKYQNGPL